jgi:hypothetical protein
MDAQLTEIITRMGDTYKEKIQKGSRNILELDLGEEATKLGYVELGHCLHGVEAVVPIKAPGTGMKVRIDGRTFVNYAEYESGIAVPGRVAKEIGLPSTPFTPADSFIRHFH